MSSLEQPKTVLSYRNVSSFRTNKQLYQEFKDITKTKGLDTCFVLNSFIQAYIEANQIGQANLTQIMKGATQSVNGSATPTELHVHNHYVVRSPRRTITLNCQAPHCKNQATNLLVYPDKRTYQLCPTHTNQYRQYTKEPILPLIEQDTQPPEVNICSTIHTEKQIHCSVVSRVFRTVFRHIVSILKHILGRLS